MNERISTQHFRSADGLSGRYELFDAGGRLVGHGTYGTGPTTVDTDQLASGHIPYAPFLGMAIGPG